MCPAIGTVCVAAGPDGSAAHHPKEVLVQQVNDEMRSLIAFPRR